MKKMEWSRAKTILIIFFVFVNIFLFVKFFSNVADSNDNIEMIDGVVKILNDNNISIDKSIIPEEDYNFEQFTVTNAVKSSSESLKLVFSEAKNLKNDGDDFYYEYTSDKLSNLSEKKVLSFVKSELKGKSILTDADYKIYSSQNADGSYTVKYNPSYEGKDIVDVRLEFNLNNEGLVKVSGYNWLVDTVEGTKNVVTASPVTEVLLNFADDDEVKKILPVKITGVDLKYYVGSRDGEISTVTALPVWRVSTDKNRYFYFDIRDGKKIEE